jgi:hypothetical protein
VARVARRAAGRHDAEMTMQREATRWAKQAATLIASVQDAELRDDLRLRFEERAAICEVDGRLTRAEAERVAYDGVVAAVDRLRRDGAGGHGSL